MASAASAASTAAGKQKERWLAQCIELFESSGTMHSNSETGWCKRSCDSRADAINWMVRELMGRERMGDYRMFEKIPNDKVLTVRDMVDMLLWDDQDVVWVHDTSATGLGYATRVGIQPYEEGTMVVVWHVAANGSTQVTLSPNGDGCHDYMMRVDRMGAKEVGDLLVPGVPKGDEVLYGVS